MRRGQVSLLSCMSGTPAEKYKSELVKIVKKLVVEGKPITFNTINKAIQEHNAETSDEMLTEDELANSESYVLVTQAIWKGINDGELKFIVPPPKPK